MTIVSAGGGLGVLHGHISYSFRNIIIFCLFFTEIHLYLLNILPTLTCASPYFVTVASEENPNGLLPEHHRQVPSAHPVPRSASTSDYPRSPFNKAAPHQTSQPACQRSSSTPPNFWPPSSPSHLCSAPPDPASLSTPPHPNPPSAPPGPKLSSIPPPNSPLPSSAAVRKALYRAKEKLLSSTKTTALKKIFQKVKTPTTKVDQTGEKNLSLPSYAPWRNAEAKSHLPARTCLRTSFHKMRMMLHQSQVPTKGDKKTSAHWLPYPSWRILLSISPTREQSQEEVYSSKKSCRRG